MQNGSGMIVILATAASAHVVKVFQSQSWFGAIKIFCVAKIAVGSSVLVRLVGLIGLVGLLLAQFEGIKKQFSLWKRRLRNR